MQKFSLVLALLSCVMLSSCATVSKVSRLPDPPTGLTPVEASDTTKEKVADYTQKRLEVFAKEDITKEQNATVFLGDSITERYPLAKYFPNLPVVNRGIGGDNMGLVKHFGVYNRLDSTVYNLHPKRIILMIAINDIIWSKGTPFDTKLKEYSYLVWKLRHDLPQTELWCVSVLPVRGTYTTSNAAVITFNKNIADACNLYGAHYLDIYNQFTDEKGQLKQEYAADAVHPSPAGYELLTRIYKQKIFKTNK